MKPMLAWKIFDFCIYQTKICFSAVKWGIKFKFLKSSNVETKVRGIYCSDWDQLQFLGAPQGLIEVLTKLYGLQLPKLPYAIKDTKSCHFFT